MNEAISETSRAQTQKDLIKSKYSTIIATFNNNHNNNTTCCADDVQFYFPIGCSLI